VGKRISDFATLGILVLFIATLSFWGCSDNNPAATGSTRSIANNNNLEGDLDGGANDYVDDLDIKDPYPPELPEIDDGGKGSDSSFADRLVIDGEKTVNLAAAADVIDRNGGLIEDILNGKFIRLNVLPQCVSTETIFTMSVQKGKNYKDEDLYLIDFSPAATHFTTYPILEIQDEPCDEYIESQDFVEYELYYWAAGTWVKYADRRCDPTGVAKFYIPHFSTYAVLKKGPDFGHDFYEL
jgi:hypothetical protein